MKVVALALLVVLVAGDARAEEVPSIDLDGCPLLDADAARRAIAAELTVPPAQRARLPELRIVITCPDADGALVEIRASGAPLYQRLAFGDLVGAQRLRLMAVVVAELVAQHMDSERAGGPVAITPAPPPVTRAALMTELGASFVAGWSAAAITGGGSLELWLGRVTSRWAGHLSLLGLSSAQQALPPGSVSWTRPRLAVGGRYRFAGGRHLSLDLRADAVGAVLVLSGAGFSANETALAFDPGVSAGVRVGVPWGRWTWFIEASALGWLRGQRAAVMGLADAIDLPRGEALFQVGLTVSLGQAN
jgi:hypothetical protein